MSKTDPEKFARTILYELAYLRANMVHLRMQMNRIEEHLTGRKPSPQSEKSIQENTDAAFFASLLTLGSESGGLPPNYPPPKRGDEK